MSHILVLESEPGLAGIVGRLVGGRHTVTEHTNAQGVIQPPAPGVRFDAIVCDMPDPWATYEVFSKTDLLHACKIIFVVTSASAGSIQDLPNPRLIRPFPLSELASAIDAMVAGGGGGSPPP